MKASETNLQEITEGASQYLVPLFQRPYSWEKRQWQELCTDLIDLCEGEGSHFIGSIVVTNIASKPNEDLTHYYLLIDGQQRLTTLFVILILLRDTVDNKTLSAKIHKLLTNEFVGGLEHFKLLPTQQDREIFKALVNREDIAIPSDHLLAKCYNFFKKEIRHRDCEQLYRVICRRLSIVEIILEDDDNPYVVFESLNAKGRSLTEADLIRNYFLMRISPDSQAEIYQNYWLPMQEALGDNLTDFMWHYLGSGGDVVRKDDVYIVLKKKIDPYPDVLEALKRIKEFSYLYKKIIDPEKETNLTIRSKLIRINHLCYQSVYSFLMNCYHEYECEKKLSENDFTSILDVIENFIVRRMICKIQTRGLNKFFPSLYHNAIQVSSNLLNGVKILLEEQKYPKDAKFKDFIIRNPFTDTKDKLKFILETIEQHISNREEDTLKPSKVEWVMPQTITSDWISQLGENWQYYHDMYVNTFGNLTLVEPNCELLNKSFSEKKNYFVNDDFVLNDYFQSVDEWNHISIEKRAEYLADKALEIWSYFGISNKTNEKGVTYTTPTTLTILGDRFPVKTWKDVYLTVLNWIIDYDPDSFIELSKEYPTFISKYYHQGIRKIYELKNGYYIETNLSAESIYQFCSQALQYLEFSDEDWNVEREKK